MKKKLLLMLLLPLLAIGVWAQAIEINGFYFDLHEESKTARLTQNFPETSNYKGNITIPNSVSYKGINYSVTTIGQLAFSESRGLTSINIPNSVTSIEIGAFDKCTGLTSITIPSSVKSIEGNAFQYCSNLTSVILNSNELVSMTYTNSHCFRSMFGNQVKEYIISDEIKKIGDYAFAFCENLKNVTIPNSVISIGKYAFYECYSLSSITLPSSLITIEDGAFLHCISLTSLEIPNSVTTIEKWAFSGLKTINIPNSITSLSRNAFSACESLETVYLNNNAIVSSDYNGNYGIDDFFGSSVKKYIIGEDVIRIGDYAFKRCDSLKSVEISNSVKSIGEGAFISCEKLENVTLGNSVKIIGDEAFTYCNNLTNITIPDFVTTIGNSAFAWCSGLTSITIPNSVSSIGNLAFYGCGALTSISVNSGNRNYDSRKNCNAIIETSTNTLIAGCQNTIIPNSVTSIGKGAFGGCTELTSIEIPNSVTTIGNSAFAYCWGMTSITIPNSVSSIGDYAFYGCRALSSITIPSSVTSIGDDAFDGCGLTKVYALRTDPAEYNIASTFFWYDGVDVSSCTLHVPIGCKEAYANTAPWSYFENIVEDIELTGIKVVEENTSSNQETETYYDLQGQHIEKPQSGIVIVRYSDGTSRKMIVK